MDAVFNRLQGSSGQFLKGMRYRAISRILLQETYNFDKNVFLEKHKLILISSLIIQTAKIISCIQVP